MNRLLALIATTVLFAAACGSNTSSDAAPASDETASVTVSSATDETTPETAEDTTPDTAPETSTTAVATTAVATTETASSGGDFCAEMDTFLGEWVNDEIGPVDLTQRYLDLATIAPAEMVEPLNVLAEGNEAFLNSQDFDMASYDAAGNAMIDYSSNTCGLSLG